MVNWSVEVLVNGNKIRVFKNFAELNLKFDNTSEFSGKTVKYSAHQNILWWVGGFFNFAERQDGTVTE